MVPELFRYEIGKLDAQDQARFEYQRLTYSRVDGEELEQDAIDNKRLNDEIKGGMVNKMMQMRIYLHD